MKVKVTFIHRQSKSSLCRCVGAVGPERLVSIQLTDKGLILKPMAQQWLLPPCCWYTASLLFLPSPLLPPCFPANSQLMALQRAGGRGCSIRVPPLMCVHVCLFSSRPLPCVYPHHRLPYSFFFSECYKVRKQAIGGGKARKREQEPNFCIFPRQPKRAEIITPAVCSSTTHRSEEK